MHTTMRRFFPDSKEEIWRPLPGPAVSRPGRVSRRYYSVEQGERSSFATTFSRLAVSVSLRRGQLRHRSHDCDGILKSA